MYDIFGLTGNLNSAILCTYELATYHMSEPVELYCTQNELTNEWIVWFPHPLGGMNVLETFDNEIAARQFWQEQMDSAEFN